jgi:beta-glucanase (GH16 family)
MMMTKEEPRLAADERSNSNCGCASGVGYPLHDSLSADLPVDGRVRESIKQGRKRIILFVMLLGLTASAQNPPPQASGYTLVASTEFNPLSLSPNNEGDYIWYNPGGASFMGGIPAPGANVSARNSGLTLAWTRGQTNPWTSISTAAEDASYYRAWRYGYFEVRMAWNPVVGAWPAIWMRPIQYTENPGIEAGELDIYEGQGATPDIFYGTIHDWSASGVGTNNGSNNYYILPSYTNFMEYHTYGLLWVPGQVTWYFDNNAVLTAATYPIFDAQDYFLILGMQEGAGGNYGNMQGVTANTMSMNVRWIHIYQQQ